MFLCKRFLFCSIYNSLDDTCTVPTATLLLLLSVFRSAGCCTVFLLLSIFCWITSNVTSHHIIPWLRAKADMSNVKMTDKVQKVQNVSNISNNRPFSKWEKSLKPAYVDSSTTSHMLRCVSVTDSGLSSSTSAS